MPDSPLQEPGISTRFINPCTLVIFGATGDLTARKLLPALYNLAREGQLPPQFACVGFARKEKTNEQFRKEVKEALNQFSRVKPVDESLWIHFQEQIFSALFLLLNLNNETLHHQRSRCRRKSSGKTHFQRRN